MVEWTAIERVSICDGEHHHSVRALDIGATMDLAATGSIIAKEVNSGKQRLYLPISVVPDFDERGKYLVASDDDGELWCSKEITSVREYTKDSVETRRYSMAGGA